MKKYLKTTFIRLTVIVFAFTLVLTLGKTALAQTAVGGSLEDQIGNLVSTLEKLLMDEKSDNGGVVMAVASGASKPTCLDNYGSWNHSSTYKTADWNLDFIPRQMIISGVGDKDPIYIDEQFVDLNGDGLSDYSYKKSVQYNSSGHIDESCVYLNNGSGFDIVFRCKAEVWYPSSEDYYGDCADMT